MQSSAAMVIPRHDKDQTGADQQARAGLIHVNDAGL
jgi:hypothetical protein